MELEVTRRDGSRHTISYDADDHEAISAHRWHVWRGRNGLTFYAMTNVRRADGAKTTLAMHVLLSGQSNMDHANGNGLDNRRCNLRPATQGQQLANQPARSGSSHFKGVHWDQARNRWVAKIKTNGKTRFLGRFTTEEAAARAYDDVARVTWGAFARCNFEAQGGQA